MFIRTFIALTVTATLFVTAAQAQVSSSTGECGLDSSLRADSDFLVSWKEVGGKKEVLNTFVNDEQIKEMNFVSSFTRKGPNLFYTEVSGLEEYAEKQPEGKDYCWAAAVRCVLKHKGENPPTQEEIVQTIRKGASDAGGVLDIMKALSETYADLSFSRNSTTHVLAAASSDTPVIFGLKNKRATIGHAYILKSITFSVVDPDTLSGGMLGKLKKTALKRIGSEGAEKKAEDVSKKAKLIAIHKVDAIDPATGRICEINGKRFKKEHLFFISTSTIESLKGDPLLELSPEMLFPEEAGGILDDFRGLL